MGNYPIGRLIAEMRGRRKLSQEELSEGICAVSTLSKIENGVQMPRRKVYVALMQRLGVSHRNCRIFVSNEEMRRCELEERMESLAAEGKYREAYDALAEYIVCGQKAVCALGDPRERLESYARGLGIKEQVLSGGEFAPAEQVLKCLALGGAASEGGALSALELQYALYQLGVIFDLENQEGGHALALFEEALRLTLRDFSGEKLLHVRFLTREEVRLLCRIAVLSYAQGERVYGKRVLFFLLEYMESGCVDPDERAASCPEILYHLSLWMGEDGRKDRQMEFCEQGVRLCIASGRLAMLPQLLSVKGCALAGNGQSAQAEPILKQSHLLLQLLGESAKADTLREQARKLFQIEVMAS